MDIGNKKTKAIIVLSLLMILCLCMASVLSFLTPNKSAEAVGNFRDTINVDNILLENYETNSKKFNGHQLDKLYSLITGVKNATYEDVLGAVKSPKTSEYFRTKNGKDITLTLFNDTVWNVTYLYTNRQGDPIATVWLASSNNTAKWNMYSDNADGNYPSNMYGTSMIRAVTLNNGGKYATSLSNMPSIDYEQDINNMFAKLTMEDIDRKSVV